MKQPLIRLEKPGDYKKILDLTYDAFLTSDYPERARVDEHFLIKLLQGSSFVIPELCFVAELDGEIAGHILYTKNKVVRPDKTEIEVIVFGPLSVLPQYQKQGIGTALVYHSLEVAREIGYGAVIITGVPEYYPKLGFKRAREYSLTLEDGSSPDFFMAYELVPGYLDGGGAGVFLPPEFEQSETDDEGYNSFNKRYLTQRFPGQITLRPLYENDVKLMEKWLYTPHVAQWYKHPKHWLDEINQRYGKFGFLSHFIVEFEGEPIGFCQYYDCYFAQEYEVWNEQCNPGERRGENFSIDYLIGDTRCLGKGYGKEILKLLTGKVRKTGAKRVIVEPEKENIASAKVLEANGYKYNGREYVLKL